MTETETTGWMYCISNESLRDGLLKIGMTLKSPEEVLIRANKSNTWNADDFKLEFAKKVQNARQKEKTLHKLLEKYNERVKSGKEFFRISVEKVRLYFDLMDGEDYKPSASPISTTSAKSAIPVKSASPTLLKPEVIQSPADDEDPVENPTVDKKKSEKIVKVKIPVAITPVAITPVAITPDDTYSQKHEIAEIKRKLIEKVSKISKPAPSAPPVDTRDTRDTRDTTHITKIIGLTSIQNLSDYRFKQVLDTALIVNRLQIYLPTVRYDYNDLVKCTINEIKDLQDTLSKFDCTVYISSSHNLQERLVTTENALVAIDELYSKTDKGWLMIRCV